MSELHLSSESEEVGLKSIMFHIKSEVRKSTKEFELEEQHHLRSSDRA